VGFTIFAGIVVVVGTILRPFFWILLSSEETAVTLSSRREYLEVFSPLQSRDDPPHHDNNILGSLLKHPGELHCPGEEKNAGGGIDAE